MIGLVVADGLITEFLIKNRFAREGNPFLERWVGGDHFLFLKTVGVILATLILWDIGKRYTKLATVATSSCVVIYTVIVYRNVLVYFLA